MEAVTALDILYNDFHRRVYGLLNSSGEAKSCGMNYTCPDGEHQCQTRFAMLSLILKLGLKMENATVDYRSLNNSGSTLYYKVFREMRAP